MIGPAVGEGRSAAGQSEELEVAGGGKMLVSGRKLCWSRAQQEP